MYIIIMGKMLIISNDAKLNTSLEQLSEKVKCDYSLFNSSNDPLNIVSEIFSQNSSLLILDDDFLSPNSEKLLISIRKVNSKLPIIFLTSDSSLELGRSINKIGVKHYLIKPITEHYLNEYIISVKTQTEKKITNKL